MPKLMELVWIRRSHEIAHMKPSGSGGGGAPDAGGRKEAALEIL